MLADLATLVRQRRNRLCGGPPDFALEPAPAHDLVIDLLELGEVGLHLVNPYWPVLRHTLVCCHESYGLCIRVYSLRNRQYLDDMIHLLIVISGMALEWEQVTGGEGRVSR